MSEFSAVIFDLDDTLFPERSFVMSGFRAASKFAASVSPVDFEALFNRLQDDFEAGVRGNSFEVALHALGFHSAELEAAFTEALSRKNRLALILQRGANEGMIVFVPAAGASVDS